MGTLRVYTTTGPGQGTSRLSWSKEGDQGNEWIEGFAQIRTTTNWKVTVTVMYDSI